MVGVWSGYVFLEILYEKQCNPKFPFFPKTELRYAVLTCSHQVSSLSNDSSKMNTIFFWFLELILSQHKAGKLAVLMSPLEPEAFSVHVVLNILDF